MCVREREMEKYATIWRAAFRVYKQGGYASSSAVLHGICPSWTVSSSASSSLSSTTAAAVQGMSVCGRRGLSGSATTSTTQITDEGETSYAALAGYPASMYADRVVLISCPSKCAMQSGVYQQLEGEGEWKMHVNDKRDRWNNPLMGWSGTADPLNHVFRSITFKSKQDAIRFAEKHGFKYEVEERRVKAPMKAKSYADKFHCLNRKGIPISPVFTSKQYSETKK